MAESLGRTVPVFLQSLGPRLRVRRDDSGGLDSRGAVAGVAQHAVLQFVCSSRREVLVSPSPLLQSFSSDREDPPNDGRYPAHGTDLGWLPHVSGPPGQAACSAVSRWAGRCCGTAAGEEH